MPLQDKINHRPPHLYIDQNWYFITAHTAGMKPLLISKQHKTIWLNEFTLLTHNYSIDIAAWVLLNNHYHLLCYFEKSAQIPEFTKHLHGVTANNLNKFDHKQGRKVWYSYWDHLIRDENDYWTKFNYIHYNPIKHEYVKHLAEWEFSSYSEILKTNGENWFADCWESYPIISFDFE